MRLKSSGNILSHNVAKGSGGLDLRSLIHPDNNVLKNNTFPENNLDDYE